MIECVIKQEQRNRRHLTTTLGPVPHRWRVRLIMSKFHQASPTRLCRRTRYPTMSDGSPTSQLILSGLVWSGPVRVRVVEMARSRPDFVAGLVVSFLNSTTRTRPDMSASATRSPTKTAPCQIPLYTDPRTWSATRPDQTHGQSPYMSRLSRQSPRTCRRPKWSLGLVWSGPRSGIEE